MKRREGLISQKDMDQINKQIASYYLEYLNDFVYLYKIDYSKTGAGAAMGGKTPGEIHFHDPIKIPCLVEIAETQNKGYVDEKKGRFEEYGNLIFSTSQEILDEAGVDIAYGDYISLPVKKDFVYYSVFDTDIKNISNEKTFGGFSPIWRIIQCAPVNKDEVTVVD
jgi:hypothetical protein